MMKPVAAQAYLSSTLVLLALEWGDGVALQTRRTLWAQMYFEPGTPQYKARLAMIGI